MKARAIQILLSRPKSDETLEFPGNFSSNKSSFRYFLRVDPSHQLHPIINRSLVGYDAAV